jgi:hypothetical protein
MAEQPTLKHPEADICSGRHSGSPESKAANRGVAERKEDQGDRVWQLICVRPMTCEEASMSLGMRYTTVSARLAQLKADFWAVKTGNHRRTTSGSMAAVVRGLSSGERSAMLERAKDEALRPKLF